MTAVSQGILLVSSTLVVADGLVTWWGTRKGLLELNPFLRHILKRSGPIALLTTRAAALGLLLLLSKILTVSLWTLLGSTFSLVLAVVLANDVRKVSSVNRAPRKLVRP